MPESNTAVSGGDAGGGGTATAGQRSAGDGEVQHGSEVREVQRVVLRRSDDTLAAEPNSTGATLTPVNNSNDVGRNPPAADVQRGATVFPGLSLLRSTGSIAAATAAPLRSPDLQTYKVAVLGDSRVGKSTVIQKFTGRRESMLRSAMTGMKKQAQVLNMVNESGSATETWLG